MSSSNIAISVKNLSKKYQIYEKPIDRLKQVLYGGRKQYYKEFEAIEDISFEVKKGETFGIIGQNGSGKSTLLQIIAATLSPTNGEIHVNGRVAALLELGSGFNPEYTGRENVYLNGSILGLSKIEMDKRFQEIEQFADIGDFMDQPVKTYSSGMYVRLAFSVAINVDADILIVDEALAVGDVFFQIKCYKKIEEYKNRGKTILLVTHDLGSVIKYCDNVLVLNQGEALGVKDAKDAVDLFKKVVVNLNKPIEKSSQIKNSGKEKVYDKWLKHYQLNTSHEDYGNNYAKIVDFGVFDEFNELTSSIEKGTKYNLKMKVKFEQTVNFPIFAFSLKDLKGTEITGTNTMIEDKLISEVKQGEVLEITFSQVLNLQGGNYLLSLGCTGFDNNEFVVYHRLYDIITFQVISSKNTVGFFDPNSMIEITTLK